MKVKYLIVGAGVSGLSFATQVDDYVVIEREHEPGGLCRTIKRNGYTWDYSGHFFHFHNPIIKEMFLNSIDEAEIIEQDKCTKIYIKGLFVDFPFQKNIHQLEKKDFINCLYDLYFKEEKDHYNNFEDMLYGKFGKSITELFLKPYNTKLYACNLNQLETDAMGRFFPYANVKEIFRNMRKEENTSYNSTFLYPRGGANTFIDVLLNKLNKNKVWLDCELLKIDSKRKIAYTSKKEIEYEYLINTIPLNNLCTLLGNKQEELSSNMVLVFNLGFNKKSKYTNYHWIYFPESKYNFYRVGFYDNILNDDKLSLYVEIGFKENETIDIEAELDKTLKGLNDVGISDGLTLIDYEAILMNPAYVHVTDKSEKMKRRLFNNLEKMSIYTLGRYGKWTYCSIEDCVDWALQLSRRLANER